MLCHEDRLKKVHPYLRLLVHCASQSIDLSVICGHRNAEDQDYLFGQGLTQLKFPHSKHNLPISLAVDISPSPVNFSNRRKNMARYYFLAGIMKAEARSLSLDIRWGGDWNQDNNFENNNFDDLLHYELIL